MNGAKLWDVAVIGSVNTDYSIRGVKALSPGETAKGESFHETLGGKGANQAVAAARLGGRVTFVCRTGRDARGAAAEDRLRSEGVDLSFATRDPDAPTGVALILIDHSGEKAIAVAPGANDRLTAGQVESAAPALRAARVVLCQLEIPLTALAEALRIGKEAGAQTILDPAPAEPLSDELLRRLDVIRMNAQEAGVLTGVNVHDRDTARRAATRLRDRGVAIVAVQAGNEGNLIVGPGEEHFLPRIPVQTVDATGAGDAFAGALAVALAEGRPLAEAGSLANAAAALATTKVGAQEGLPRREQIHELLARNGGRPSEPDA